MIFLGFSGDGDTRILSSMKSMSGIGFPENVPKEFENFFFGNINPHLANYQDYMHICVKLLRRTMKNLKIGEFSISISHLKNIRSLFGKDQHLLVESDLKDEDKMSYEVVKKICSENVENCFKELPNAHGTKVYLKLIKSLQLAYIENSTKATDRVKFGFYAVFLCRIWKNNLSKLPQKNNTFASTTKTFITSNCYSGIEINAHSLIVCIMWFRELNLDSNFLVFLFSSQSCESFFRILRSMTSTFSTIVNFNLQEVLWRVKRSQALNEIINKLKGEYHFARINKDKQHLFISKLPTNEEIVSTVNQALVEAVDDCISLGKLTNFKVLILINILSTYTSLI